MVSLSRKDLLSKLAAVKAMKDHKDLVCLTKLENDGLVLSSVVKSVGACAWLLSGEAGSEKVEHYTLDLTKFSEACSSGKSDDIDLDFVEEEQSSGDALVSLTVTTDRVVVRLIVTRESASPVSGESLDTLLAELTEETAGGVEIDATALGTICGIGLRRRRDKEEENEDTSKNIRYRSTYITLSNKILTACRYTRKNAVHLSKSVECDENASMNVVTFNHVLDGVVKQFLAGCGDTDVTVTLQDDKVLGIATDGGILTIPVNGRLEGIDKENIGDFDVLTPAIEEMRNSGDASTIAEISTEAVVLRDTMSIVSRFGTERRINLKIQMDGKIVTSAAGRGVDALASMEAEVEGMTEDLLLEDQDPRNLTEVLGALLSLKPGDAEDMSVKLEFVRPVAGKEADREKMVIITADNFKGVSVWEG